jgi:hypothetical protein
MSVSEPENLQGAYSIIDRGWRRGGGGGGARAPVLCSPTARLSPLQPRPLAPPPVSPFPPSELNIIMS